MRVTVVVCTWNRAKLLDKTLATLHELKIPEGVEWELLVVNNNCSDQTDVVLQEHQGSLPLRRLFEPNPGHSRARNLAILESKGDLILWTDDDVLVHPNWLSEYVRASKLWPDAGYFGGTIEPLYEVDPPRWVVENTESLEGMLVVRDFGTTERYLVGSEQPWGANMAFRREVFRHLVFDPRLGLKGDGVIRGDESFLISKLRREGVAGIWVPGARVKHFVPASRLTNQYLWNFHVGIGRTLRRINGREETSRTWFGSPRWLYRMVVEFLLCATWRRAMGRTDWVWPYTRAAYCWGEITEARSQAAS